MGGRPLGLGGELVVIRDLYQGSSAPSSMANVQQESSAQQPTSILSHIKKKQNEIQKNLYDLMINLYYKHSKLLHIHQMIQQQ